MPGIRLVLLSMLAISSATLAAGTVEDVQFRSHNLPEDRNVLVFLPEGYDPEGHETFYPVIYLLPGGGVNYTCYSEVVTALDTLIGTELDPVIVVRPDANHGA